MERINFPFFPKWKVLNRTVTIDKNRISLFYISYYIANGNWNKPIWCFENWYAIYRMENTNNVLTEFQRLSTKKITIKNNPKWKSRTISLVLLAGESSSWHFGLVLSTFEHGFKCHENFQLKADSSSRISQLFFSFSILWGFQRLALQFWSGTMEINVSLLLFIFFFLSFLTQPKIEYRSTDK